VGLDDFVEGEFLPMSTLLRNLSSSALLWMVLVGSASAVPLEEMSLDRWAKLREAERYQMQIAEKYFRDRDWKVAVSEYEKFLTLYESSEGAPYAQLKWSLCQVHLRKLNTAVKDGFQSVIDYWPDAPESAAAAYFIGFCYKDMGEIKKAKKAYAEVLVRHSDQLAGVRTKVDLVDVADVEKDIPRRISLLQELAYQTKRNADNQRFCVEASQQLTTLSFQQANFLEAVKSLATTYEEKQLPYRVYEFCRTPISQLTGDPEQKVKGEKLADQAIGYIKERIPADLKDDAKKNQAKSMWFWIAEIQSYSRRGSEVGKVYEQMLTTFGNSDDILGGLANWFRAQNRRDDARAVYNRFANQIEGQNQIAATYREEGKRDQALTIYRGLLQTDPEHLDRWLWEIGHTCREMGQYQEAIKHYRQIDAFPENLKYMALCHRDLKEFAEALGLYGQMLSHEGTQPWALLQIGYTHEQAGQQEQAIRAFQRVCRQFPRTPQASQAHAHLQNKYKINSTFGGDTQ